MTLDASKPTDEEILSFHASYIREIKAALNTLEEAQAEGLLPAATLAANADTSPSVDGVVLLVTQNAGATLISFFDDAYDGQFIILLAGDAYTTVQHDSGLIQLTSLGNVKLRQGEAILLAFYDSVWHEVGGYKRTTQKIVTDATYSVLNTDVALIGNAAAGDQTFTLPLASSVSEGHEVQVKKLSSHAGVVNTIRQASDYIDNGTEYELTLEGECVTFSSDGSTTWYRFN
jgi:hypothetical protein